MAFSDKVKEYAGIAAEKGGKLVEVSKIKARINGLERDIRKIKADIAELAVEKVKAGDLKDDQLKALIEDIDGKNEEIAACYEEIEQVKN